MNWCRLCKKYQKNEDCYGRNRLGRYLLKENVGEETRACNEYEFDQEKHTIERNTFACEGSWYD